MKKSMSRPTNPPEPTVSREYVRTAVDALNKFDVQRRFLGHLHAIKNVREIGRLHTWYPGQRAEFDFTKYGIFLFPNEKWNEPVLYVDGLGIDHTSGAIGSLTTSMSSSTRDVVRLFRRYVMPKSTWLPLAQQGLAQRWDIFGIPLLAAVDNGSEFISDNATTVFLSTGSIFLRLPPGRPEMKGGVERTHYTEETLHVSRLPGYVPKKYVGLDPRYSKARKRAKLAANMTVAEYEAQRVVHALEFNETFHPRLKKRRIDAFREGQEQAPCLLLTNHVQERMTFGLTYFVKLTREGVEVETLKFSSPELHELFLVHTGRVYVKLDPDDVRSVLVDSPQWPEPIEAFLNTFTYQHAVSLELYQHIRSVHIAEAEAANCNPEDVPFAFASKLQEVQGASTTTPMGSVTHKQIQAVSKAAAMPVAQPQTQPTLDLSSLLAGSKFSDDR